ncbi:MAG: hypothetical protein ABR880_23530 [Candidatus Sulfotelmatobacter sp.]|jgi:hypothetical protein
MDLEKELLDAFDRVLHEDFPNPQRIDCPERQVLLKLAQHPRTLNSPTWWITFDGALRVLMS